MTKTSRYSLARRLIRDAERADLDVQARAALLVAASLVARSVIRDPSTPFRLIPPLTADCVAASEALSSRREVH